MKKTICLTTYLKNSEDTVIDSLNKILKNVLIDYWVIMDTSSDRTGEIVNQYFLDKKIDGYMIKDDSINDTGYIKTLLLMKVYEKFDYAFLYDFDYQLFGNFELPELVDNCYSFKFVENGLIYYSRLLVSLNNQWLVDGSYFEDVYCKDNDNAVITPILGDYDFVNNREVTLESIEEAINAGALDELNYKFHYARMLNNVDRVDDALKYFIHYIDNGGDEQYRYFSALCAGDILSKKGRIVEAMRYWSKTFLIDSSRIEGAVNMSYFGRENNIHMLCNMIYERYKKYDKNVVGKMYLDPKKYSNFLEYNNLVASYYVQDHRSGFECGKKILEEGIGENYVIESVFFNLKFYESSFVIDDSFFKAVNNGLRVLQLRNLNFSNNVYEFINKYFETFPLKVIRYDSDSGISKKLIDNGMTKFNFYESIDGENIKVTDLIARYFLKNKFGNDARMLERSVNNILLIKSLIEDYKNHYYVIDENVDVRGNFVETLGESVEDFVIFGRSGSGEILGYKITKDGARKVLNYANSVGMRNGFEDLIFSCPGLNVRVMENEMVVDSGRENIGRRNKDLENLERRLDEVFYFYPAVHSKGEEFNLEKGNYFIDYLRIIEGSSDFVGFNTFCNVKTFISVSDLTSDNIYNERTGNGVFIKKNWVDNILDTYFDRIFFINLKNSKKRLINMVEMFKRYNIKNYERFDAVDVERADRSGWKYPLIHLKEQSNYVNYDITKRQLAVKLSHYSVLEIMKNRGYNKILVMEDDIDIHVTNMKNIYSNLNLVKQNRLDWDMFYFFGSYPNIGSEIYGDVRPLKHTSGLVTYAVNKRNLDYIMDELKNQHNYPADDVFCNFIHRSGRLKNYCTYPWCVDLTNVYSTITKNIKIKILSNKKSSKDIFRELRYMQTDFLTLVENNKDIDFYVIFGNPGEEYYEPSKTILLNGKEWNYDKKNELYHSEEDTEIVLWTKDVPYFITNEKKDRVITRLQGINDERVDSVVELGNNDMLDYKYCLIEGDEINIYDAILSNCLIFYKGDKEYNIDSDLLVKVNDENMSEVISRAIEEKYWESRFEKIVQEKHNIIKNKCIFSVLEKIIETRRISQYFVFFNGKDQSGYDLFHHRKPVKEAFEYALADKDCVAFNTVGFFKSKIDNLQDSTFYTKENDGIYVKRDYYEKFLNN